MKISEIYLQTAFVCSACDNDISSREIALVKNWSGKNKFFSDINVESKLNEYVESINKYGKIFIEDFLILLKTNELTSEQQLEIIRIAIGIIEADGQVLYSEVKFFKRLRSCLSISDDAILEVMPDKEDYLLPDIKTSEYVFNENIKFAEIILNPDL